MPEPTLTLSDLSPGNSIIDVWYIKGGSARHATGYFTGVAEADGVEWLILYRTRHEDDHVAIALLDVKRIEKPRPPLPVLLPDPHP
jgi:hypothetical protein